MVKSGLSPDEDQTRRTVAQYEGSPELQGPRTPSMWRSADPHRGEPTLDPASDDMRRFTATGRPFVADDPYQSWAGFTDGDISGGGTGKNLPLKYTDESVISVPCLRPPPDESIPEATDKKKKKWWRRISSRYNSSDSVDDPKNFIMKRMTRGEYLKHYCMDEQDNYAGMEEPAEDCILKGKDLKKYRGGKETKWANEIVEDIKEGLAPVHT
jgi:hypothetical protein